MKISGSCYAITGLGYLPPWSVNSGINAGQSRTLVVDTGATLLAAQTIYGYAAALSPHGQIVAVNTEKHLDHLGGNHLFRELGFDIYGHSGVVRHQHELTSDRDALNACIPNQIRREAHEAALFFYDTQIVNPNLQVQPGLRLDLGGLHADILMTPGHTLTNLSVWVEAERVLFCGDCLVSGYLPNLESGNPELWEIWQRSLDQLQYLRPQLVVPGHGQILVGPEVELEIERHRHILHQAIAEKRPPTIRA